MPRHLFLTLLLLSLLGRAQSPQVRIKDVTRRQGDETYTLVGYGLVVGLAGTGDSSAVLSQRTLSNLLHNFNIKIDEEELKGENAAVVMLTARVHTGAHDGDQVHVTVSSVGDADSLTGGELLLTPMLGPDGKPWAIAQGAVTTGGFSFGTEGAGGDLVVKNHPTAGSLTAGAKLLRDIPNDSREVDFITFFLQHPDITTAVNMAEAINAEFYGAATAVDAATVRVQIPGEYRQNGTVTTFLGQVEQLRFAPDQPARVVFNERTGTIIIGSEVRISSVAISHGAIAINIKSTEAVSQPAPFSEGGNTARMSDTQTSVQEDVARTNVLPATTTVGELVEVLNSLGVTPRDIMQIFHALRQAGALHAELQAL